MNGSTLVSKSFPEFVNNSLISLIFETNLVMVIVSLKVQFVINIEVCNHA